VRVHTVPLPAGVQHLLGAVVPLDDGLALVDPATCTAELRAAVEGLGYRLLEPPADDAERAARATNVVVLRPGELVMPAGCPRTRGALVDAGCTVHEVDVEHHVRAGGGPGCLTGILLRAARPLTR
jgi:N-dimethylarginine dimethylaminohydrolase